MPRTTRQIRLGSVPVGGGAPVSVQSMTSTDTRDVPATLAQIRALAEAEAEKVARIGIAQALATEEQVRAYGGPQFQVTQQVLNRFSEAVQQSKVDVVPRGVVGANKDGGTGNVMEALLTMLLSDRFGALAKEAQGVRSEEVEQLRSEIRKSMSNKTDKKE